MAVIIYLCIILVMTNQSSTDLNGFEIDIIASLGKRFGLRHNLIINSNNNKKDISAIKRFSTQNIFSVYGNYRVLFNDLIKITTSPQRTAIISTSHEEDIKNFLQNLYSINPTNYSIMISRYVWMLFAPNRYLDNYFSLFIPYDCQFFVITQQYEILEMYRLNYNKEVLTDQLGEWNEKNGLEMKKSSSIAERRRNLNGQVMRFGRLNRKIPDKPGQLIAKYHREIWFDLGKIMNFSTVECVYVSNDRTDADIDAGSPSVVMHADYYERNLLGPTFSYTTFMHVKYESDNGNGFQPYFRPFEKEMWIGIMFLIIVSTIVSVVLEYCSRNKTNKKWTTILINFGFCAFDSLCNQSGTPRSQFWSTRLAIFIPKIASCVILPCYSAAVIAFLTVQFPKIPFNNLEELAQNNNFKVSAPASYIRIYFESNKNPVANRIRKNMWLKDEELPATITDGVELLCNHDNYVFLAYNDDIFLMEEASCEVLKIPTPVFRTAGAMQLAVNSSYINVFNKMLRKFYFNGVIKRMTSTMYKFNKNSEEEIHYQSLDVFKIFFMLTILLSGIIISILLFLFENIFKNRHDFKTPTV